MQDDSTPTPKRRGGAKAKYSLLPRPCEICGTTIYPRPGQAPSHFRWTLTCSEECRRVKIGNGNRGKKHPIPTGSGSRRKYLDNEKPCENCGKIMVRADGDEPNLFNRRKACSPECTNALRKARNPRRVIHKPKTCIQCGALMVQGKDELAMPFSLRRTCSVECKVARIAKESSKTKRSKYTEKFCNACGVLMLPSDGEQFDNFRKRETCSKECQMQIRAKTCRARYPESKACLVCGVEFGPSEAKFHWHFRDRQTCSKKCAHVLAGRKRRWEPSKSPYGRGWTPDFKAKIRKRDSDKCVLCESTDRLAVHHIDYHKTNCREDNLITLCISCHGKTNHGDRRQWQVRFFAILVERGIVDLEDIAA